MWIGVLETIGMIEDEISWIGRYPSLVFNTIQI